MYIGLGIFLLVVGAILYFAVGDTSLSGIDLTTVGIILMVAGALIPGWGWVLLALVTLFLAWLLVLGWPRLSSQERLMRVAVVALALAITITQAFPR